MKANSNMANPIVVELGSDKQNVNPYLTSMKKSYRGIYRKSNDSPGIRQSFRNARAPDRIPGFHVTVDVDAKTVKISEPLNDERNSSIKEQLVDFLEKPEERVRKRSYEPVKNEVISGLAPESLFDWITALWVLCEDDKAQLRKGVWPKAVVERINEDRLEEQAAHRKKNHKPVPALV